MKTDWTFQWKDKDTSNDKQLMHQEGITVISIFYSEWNEIFFLVLKKKKEGITVMNVYQSFKIHEGKLVELKKKEGKSIIMVVHLNTHLWKINGTPLKPPT